jgi:hypothetical protein
LEKVTEVASARLAERWINCPAGEPFGFSLCGDGARSIPSDAVIFGGAVWACLAIRSKEIRILE